VRAEYSESKETLAIDSAAMEIPENTDLVKLAQSGDHRRLEELTELARDRLISYFNRMVRDEHLVDDLVQEGLLEMIESLKTLEDAERFWPWLYRIAHNKICDHFRLSRSVKKRYHAKAMAAHTGTEPERGPQAAAGHRELVQIMRDAMEEIKLSYRSILILRVFEQLPYTEIAVITGHSELNTRALFFRAKSALRKRLSARGLNKSALMVALTAFGQSTRPTRVAAADVALSTASMEAGLLGSGLGLLGTKVGIAGLIGTGMCVLAALVASQDPETDLQAVQPGPVVQSESELQVPLAGDAVPSLSRPLTEPNTIEAITDANTQAEPSPQPLIFTTIQAAIDDANNGDVVIVPSGVYTGPGNRDVDFKGKGITLTSEAGAEDCVIDCQEKGRGFHFHNGENRGSVLNGFTIRNGRAQDGGAILCEKTSPVIANCILENNTALSSGGAIAGGSGVIQDCLITGNQARAGGGVRGCQGVIKDCILHNNLATNRGGGLNACHGSIQGCTIIMNVVETWDGGGLWDCDGRITNCFIIENATATGGGGLCGCDGLIANCVIARNMAGNTHHNTSGAGLFACRGTIRNCTIVANEVTGLGTKFYTCGSLAQRAAQGAGIYCIGGKTTVVNCIVWGNRPGQIDHSDSQGACEVSYSTIEGAWPGVGNLSDPPRFNREDLDEWSLAHDSPCINAGDPNLTLDPTELDVQDQLRLVGGRVDMGANEFVDMSRLYAVAGPDQVFHEVCQVQLDASLSLKCNAVDTLDFAWHQISGPPVHLSDPNSARVTLAPELAGTYEFALTVSDGLRSSRPDIVAVRVGYNQGPQANPGEDQLFSAIPAKVVLDGANSADPEGDTLSYAWRQISGPPVDLNEPDVASCEFTPNTPGVYTFKLTVTDDRGAADANTLEVVVGSDSLLWADAGSTVYAGSDPVRLDGSASHTDTGDQPATFHWKQTDGPYALVLQHHDTAIPTVSGFTPADSMQTQTFVFELTIGDATQKTHSNQVDLVVGPAFHSNRLILENDSFDPAKPTFVFFGGESILMGGGNRRWQSHHWQEHANILSCDFSRDTLPPEEYGPRRYERCGAMLIAYLNRLAPAYNQAIQVIGFAGGGMAALDVARYVNTVFADPRYTTNKVVLLSFGNSSVYLAQESIDMLHAHPVKDETCSIENYFTALPQPYLAGIGPVKDVLNVQFNTDDIDFVLGWYKNSLTYPDLRQANDGVVAGAHWSVIGPGWNAPLEPGTYHYQWEGSTTHGRMRVGDGKAD